MLRTHFVLVGGLLASAFAPAADLKAPALASSEVAKLIDQLGDRDYATREAATLRLTQLGEAALSPLESVRTNDPEVRQRAELLVARIRSQLENERALAATTVTLSAGETTLQKLFAELERQTGYQIRVDGDQAVLASTVRPPAGTIPFWKAVDQLGIDTGMCVAQVTSTQSLSQLRGTARAERSSPATVLGTVVLKSRGGDAPAPLSVQGAVRVESQPPAQDSLNQYPPEQLLVRLRVIPEPKIRWGGSLEATVIRAVTEDGREVAMYYQTDDFRRTAAQNNLFAQIETDQRSTKRETPNSVLYESVRLLAPAGEPVTKLKQVEGWIRGGIWTAPSEILAVRGIEVGKPVTAGGANSSAMTVLVSPPTDQVPNNLILDVTVRYPGDEIRPETGGGANDPVWIENRGGRAVIRGATTRGRPANALPGLVVRDVDGQPLDVSVHRSVRSTRFDGSRMLTIEQHLCYVRPAVTGEPATIGTIAFRAARVRPVTIPFQLTDVLVAAGIRTEPQSDDAIRYK